MYTNDDYNHIVGEADKRKSKSKKSKSKKSMLKKRQRVEEESDEQDQSDSQSMSSRKSEEVKVIIPKKKAKKDLVLNTNKTIESESANSGLKIFDKETNTRKRKLMRGGQMKMFRKLVDLPSSSNLLNIEDDKWSIANDNDNVSIKEDVDDSSDNESICEPLEAKDFLRFKS